MSDISAKKRMNSKFAEILRNYENAESEKLFKEIEEAHVFSEEFERAMQDVFKVAEKRQKRYFYFGNKVFYKVAVIIFCILAALAGSATVYATVKWVRRYTVDFGEGTEIRYDIDENAKGVIPTKIERTYAPTWIPEGYKEVEIGNYWLFASVSYMNDNGDEITFIQTILSGKGGVINTEGGKVAEFKVGDYEAIYCENKGMTMMSWWDGSYNYTLAANNLTREEAEKIANSLEERELFEK